MTQLLRPLLVRTRRALALAVATSSALLGARCSRAPPPAASPPHFITFESGHVRPLAISPDGTKLFAVNTPDRPWRLNGHHRGPVPDRRCPGRPGAGRVAARSDTEVWVVNHLSDSISVVIVSGTPHVVRTLLVGDEPRDIVFAGASGLRVHHHRAPRPAAHGSVDRRRARRGRSAAHHAGRRPRRRLGLRPRALGDDAGRHARAILTLFGDTPRALASARTARRSTRRIRSPATGRRPSTWTRLQRLRSPGCCLVQL